MGNGSNFWWNLVFWLNATDNQNNSTTLEADSHSACDWFMFLVPGVLAAITIVLGVTGNIFSLAVIWRIGRGSLTFRLVTILAVLDSILLILYLVAKSFPDIITFIYNRPHPHNCFIYLKFYLYPVVAMCSTASTWMTVLITTYRFIMAKKLFKRSSVYGVTSVSVQVAAIFVVSILLDLSKYFEFRPVQCYQCTIIVLEPTDLWMNPLYQLLYRNILLLAFRRVCPFVITVIMVYKRVRLLETWRLSRLRKFNLQRLPNDQDRVSRVLIVMAIISIACHAPSLIYPIVRSISDATVITCEKAWFIYLGYVSDYLVLFNSSVTFYLFYAFIPQYRKTVRNLLRGSRKGRRGVSTQTQRSTDPSDPGDPARDERARTLSAH